jgi:hypothetical protein
MVDRPTAVWRADVARDAADLAAGVIGPEDAVSARLWPDEMIRATDAVLDGFEADVAGLADHRWEASTDAEVLEVIERTVRALNAVNNQFHGAAYETDERELLCEYIDRVLGASGIEADELARRNGLDGGDVTGPWRDW